MIYAVYAEMCFMRSLSRTAYVSAYTNKFEHLYFKTDFGVSDQHITCKFLSPGNFQVACFATMAVGYNKQEIARGEGRHALTVNVSLNLISFLEINEIDQTLKVVMEMERSWFDSQLTLLHVQEDSNLNTL